MVYDGILLARMAKALERTYGYTLMPSMLVKINDIDTIANKVKVTQLDIDDYGSIVPVKELELNMSADETIPLTLKNSSFAAIFTSEDDERTIILGTGMTLDELNQEKSKTIAKANSTQN